jgi:hypothetical protein
MGLMPTYIDNNNYCISQSKQDEEGVRMLDSIVGLSIQPAAEVCEIQNMPLLTKPDRLLVCSRREREGWRN